MQKFVLKRLEALLDKAYIEKARKADFLKESKVLIVAPHFDDDVLSCFGAIKEHMKTGSEIDIVYVTDGSASKNSGMNSHYLSLVRKEEAKKALKRIKSITNIMCMDLKDGKLAITEKEVEKLIFIISARKYNYIYCPHYTDTHNDHKEAYKLVMNAVKRVRFDIIIRYYEFWYPLKNPNIYIDISDEWTEKIDAINCHKTQMLYLDYIELVEKLNSIRGIQVGCKYAEIFEEQISRNYKQEEGHL